MLRETPVQLVEQMNPKIPITVETGDNIKTFIEVLALLVQPFDLRDLRSQAPVSRAIGFSRPV